MPKTIEFFYCLISMYYKNMGDWLGIFSVTKICMDYGNCTHTQYILLKTGFQEFHECRWEQWYGEANGLCP